MSRAASSQHPTTGRGHAGWPETVATLGPVGRLPGAPGTYGSAVGIGLAWALHAAGGAWLMISATLAIIALGWWTTTRVLAARDTPDADPGDVVIDEVAGQMIAFWPLSIGLTMAGAGPEVWPWPGVVFGFLAFRALDILKPPPVSTAERLPGAAGVMADDIVAGLITAAAATLAAGVAHGWI
ncbi:MAG: phosphatidylglycerophosphatase A [Pseudomonadota bacterium]